MSIDGDLPDELAELDAELDERDASRVTKPPRVPMPGETYICDIQSGDLLLVIKGVLILPVGAWLELGDVRKDHRPSGHRGDARVERVRVNRPDELGSMDDEERGKSAGIVMLDVSTHPAGTAREAPWGQSG